jgi:hypothetical protein
MLALILIWPWTHLGLMRACAFLPSLHSDKVDGVAFSSRLVPGEGGRKVWACVSEVLMLLCVN